MSILIQPNDYESNLFLRKKKEKRFLHVIHLNASRAAVVLLLAPAAGGVSTFICNRRVMKIALFLQKSPVLEENLPRLRTHVRCPAREGPGSASPLPAALPGQTRPPGPASRRCRKAGNGPRSGGAGSAAGLLGAAG